MSDQGVTYIVSSQYIQEAEYSAQTAQKFGLKTCLIAPQYQGKVFDEFIKIQMEIKCTTQRVPFYPLSPWEETLYLDVDTQVLGDLAFGFAMAQKFGIALVLAPAGMVKYHWGIEDRQIPLDLPDYNGGVIFFNRGHPQMRDFWQTMQRALSQKINLFTLKRNEKYNDQSLLSILLYKKRINPYILPPNWNLRPQYGMRSGFGPIKIWHSRNNVPVDFHPQQSSWWSLDKTEA